MSAQTDNSAEAPKPSTKLRTPERRSMLLAVLMLLVTYGAYRASTFPWFQGAWKEGGEWTWADLTPEALATLGVVPSPTGDRPAMYEIAGMPAATTWILVAALAGLLAFISRLGILALIGVGAVWMARTSAIFAQEILFDSEQLTGRIVETAGLNTYLDWCWLLMGSLLVLAAQITYAGHRHRKAQKAAGLEQDEALVDTFEGMQASLLARLARTSPTRAGAKNSNPAESPAEEAKTAGS